MTTQICEVTLYTVFIRGFYPKTMVFYGGITIDWNK